MVDSLPLASYMTKQNIDFDIFLFVVVSALQKYA